MVKFNLGRREARNAVRGEEGDGDLPSSSINRFRRSGLSPELELIKKTSSVNQEHASFLGARVLPELSTS